MKKAACACFVVLILFALMPFSSKAQTTTTVIGQINSDTSWTKTNSPYTLVGSLTVENGSILTVEPGVIVYLGNYQLIVLGSLIAKGSNSEPVTFIEGKLSLTDNSVFEKVVAKSSSISVRSASITDCIVGSIGISGDAKISNNNIGEIGVSMGSPVISDNNISVGISTSRGNQQSFPTIINNNLTDSASFNFSPIGYGISCSGYAVISDNLISNWQSGIYLSGIYSDGSYYNNGIPLIQHNTIINNTKGIEIHFVGDDVAHLSILNNTIKNNQIGIDLTDYNKNDQSTYVFNFNNVYDNSIFNLHLDNYISAAKVFSSTDGSYTPCNVDATYNWWGNTDEKAINSTIGYIPFVGSFSFMPFLTQPNSQAAPNPNTPIPTPVQTVAPTVSPESSIPSQSISPSQNPTASPDHPGAESSILFGLSLDQVVIVALGVVVVLLVFVVVFLRKRTSK
jgi:hypothetical protein